MAHWNRKHVKAAYVPSLMQGPPPEYCYGAVVHLSEGTDVLLLLGAFASGAVYYNPGIKKEGVETGKPVTKRRSQFRVKHGGLETLYRSQAVEDLLSTD